MSSTPVRRLPISQLTIENPRHLPLPPRNCPSPLHGMKTCFCTSQICIVASSLNCPNHQRPPSCHCAFPRYLDMSPRHCSAAQICYCCVGAIRDLGLAFMEDL
ncbi:hypothetical protein Salat_1165700 [Sesamum alatum]|uniref:Uncharacterized protein n=1 Tax=Sesamum alatum TaxID=300844 RepID=A0AAE2CNS1_9LAMI|nr:hypothetical protein Salat_1165700 [Sesamum alatum]